MSRSLVWITWYEIRVRIFSCGKSKWSSNVRLRSEWWEVCVIWGWCREWFMSGIRRAWSEHWPLFVYSPWGCGDGEQVEWYTGRQLLLGSASGTWGRLYNHPTTLLEEVCVTLVVHFFPFRHERSFHSLTIYFIFLITILLFPIFFTL